MIVYFKLFIYPLKEIKSVNDVKNIKEKKMIYIDNLYRLPCDMYIN
jgi:hypothetical protein